MAKPQLFALACLALLAVSTAQQPQCTYDAETQRATLAGERPRGCLTEDLVMNTVGISKDCFNNVTLYRQGGAGCTSFGVGLLDGNNEDCIPGPVGNGTLKRAPGGGYTASGEFLTGQKFTGTQSADNRTMTVSVDEFNCELTYRLAAAPATAGNRTAAGNMTAAALPGANETDAADATTAVNVTTTTAPATTRSSAAAALPAALLMVLSAAVVVAL